MLLSLVPLVEWESDSRIYARGLQDRWRFMKDGGQSEESA